MEYGTTTVFFTGGAGQTASHQDKDLSARQVAQCNVAVIGAGPYGLSVAASLREAGVNCRIFGRPMQTWRTAVPASLQLKSDGFASNLVAPNPGSTLADYCRQRSIPYDDEYVRVQLSTFLDYGLDFQSRYVPNLDQREVVGIARDGDMYRINLEDGTAVTAKRAVLAVGITHFAHVPEVLGGLPSDRVTHSSAHRQFSEFAGKEVIVVGAGASAVEAAALLDDSGARASLLVRAGEVRFNGAPTAQKRTLWQRLRNPKSGLGPGMASWLCCTFPQLYRLLPAASRMKLLHRHLGPKSHYHFRHVIATRVPVLLRHEVEACGFANNKVELRCRDGAGNAVTLHADHVIAATGYAARVDCLRFLAPELRSGIETYQGYPILSPNFESSVPGLYFVGLAAAGTFGPLMRFVYGAEYTVKRLAAHLA